MTYVLRFIHTGCFRCVALRCGAAWHRTVLQRTASGVNEPLLYQVTRYRR